MFRKNNNIIILKSKCVFTTSEYEMVYHAFLKQKESGLILLPPHIDLEAVIADEDLKVELKYEKEKSDDQKVLRRE